MLIRKSISAPVRSKAAEGLFSQRIYALVCRASQYNKPIIAGGIIPDSPMVNVHRFTSCTRARGFALINCLILQSNKDAWILMLSVPSQDLQVKSGKKTPLEFKLRYLNIVTIAE